MNAPRMPDPALKAKLLRLVREDPDVRMELMKALIQFFPTRQETNDILHRIEELHRVAVSLLQRMESVERRQEEQGIVLQEHGKVLSRLMERVDYIAEKVDRLSARESQ